MSFEVSDDPHEQDLATVTPPVLAGRARLRTSACPPTVGSHTFVIRSSSRRTEADGVQVYVGRPRTHTRGGSAYDDSSATVADYLGPRRDGGGLGHRSVERLGNPEAVAEPPDGVLSAAALGCTGADPV